MEHRHINSSQWTAATIDSALERGNLQDWRELFAVVERDRAVAELVLAVVVARPPGGATVLAKAMVERMRSGDSQLKAPNLSG
jgi:hypothetical protein